MNARPSISSVKVAWILFRIAIRRFVNQWQSLQPHSSGPRDKGMKKSGKLGSSILGWIWPPLLFLFFFCIGLGLASHVLLNIAHSIPSEILLDGKIAVEVSSPTSVKDAKSSQNSTEVLTGDLIRIAKTRAWVSSNQESTFIKCIGLLIGLLFFSSVMTALGITNKNMGQINRSLEWLYTLPVSTRGYYLYKIINDSLHNPIMWGFLFPLLFCALVLTNAGGIGLCLSFIATGYLSMLAAGVVTVTETGMRKRVSQSSIKMFQAGFTVLGVLFPTSYIACSSSPKIAGFFVSYAARLPIAILWQPLSLPAVFLWSHISPVQIGLGVALLFLWTLVALGAVWVCEVMSRKGLEKSDSCSLPINGQRVIATTRGSWVVGVAGKEILYLVRDRNIVVQMFLIPLIAVALGLIINVSVLVGADGEFKHASALVFCIIGYFMASRGMLILNHEKRAIWNLFVFPRSLLSIVVNKAIVWATLAFAYAAVILLCLAQIGHLHYVSGIVSICTALYGVILFTFIAAALGILAPTGRRTIAFGHRLRSYAIYFYRLLVGMYALTIYASPFWAKLGLLIVFTAVSVALWKKVEARLPYLLDTRTS